VTLTIELMGVELHGFHGVDAEERRDGQRFLFDLWLDVPDTAARSDRIEDAVDYREVVATVREVSDGRAFQLLEALATDVAEALLARFPIERVRVRVRKPDVVLGAPVEWSAVSCERSSAPRASSPTAGS
jgi:7,8-dihydroneopterin aldolase/epimerase/oxygenase